MAKIFPKGGKTNKRMFDLSMDDRFMCERYNYDGTLAEIFEVEVVSPYDYEGLPYGLGRILMNKFYDNVVYAVRTDDRSMIIPFKSNYGVFAY